MVERSTVESADIEWSLVRFRVSGFFFAARSFLLAILLAVVCFLARSFAVDTLAEWLRRRPAKPVGSARVGSNPTGVDFFSDVRKKIATKHLLYIVADPHSKERG